MILINKKNVLCLASFILFAGSCASDESETPEGSTIGSCVLTTSRALPASSLKQVSTVSATAGTATTNPFTKTSTAYGVTLLATDNSTDSFVQDIGSTIQKMFTATGDTDSSLQTAFIENLYRYTAAIPLFAKDELTGFDFAQSKDFHSICDTISAGQGSRNDQVLEIMEHILHILTNVGFHYTLNNDWGLSTSSTLYDCMQQAVDAGYYNVSSYESIGEESRDRIKLQEFAYWFITSAWGLQTTYGASDTNEWSLKNSSNLQSNMSTCYTQLITNGANKVITVPGDSFLNALGDAHD